MFVDLDLFEIFLLLRSALNGTHLCASVLDKFVDDVYFKLNSNQRLQLFEWLVRLATPQGKFEPAPNLGGADARLMKRLHPLNQYRVHLVNDDSLFDYEMCLYGGELMYDSNYRANKSCIASIQHIPCDEWENWQHQGVDYDTDILESLPEELKDKLMGSSKK